MAQIIMRLTGEVGVARQSVGSSVNWDHSRLRNATGVPSAVSTTYGQSSYEFVGVIGTGDYMQCEQVQANFDFSSIPREAVVTAAEIEFTQDGESGTVYGSPIGALTTRFIDAAGHDFPISTFDYARMDIGNTGIIADIAYNGFDGSTSHALNSAGLAALNLHILRDEGMKFTGKSVDLINDLDYNFNDNDPWGYITASLEPTSTLVLTMTVDDEGMMGFNF